MKQLIAIIAVTAFVASTAFANCGNCEGSCKDKDKSEHKCGDGCKDKCQGEKKDSDKKDK